MPVPKLCGGLTPPPWQFVRTQLPSDRAGARGVGMAGVEGVCREDPENTALKVLCEPCVLDAGGASL